MPPMVALRTRAIAVRVSFMMITYWFDLQKRQNEKRLGPSNFPEGGGRMNLW